MADFMIRVGDEYEYTGGQPVACRGHVYRVLRIVVAVPAYQQLVLVEALTGPDAGRWFCCTPYNFSTRYRPIAKLPPVEVSDQETKSV